MNNTRTQSGSRNRRPGFNSAKPAGQRNQSSSTSPRGPRSSGSGGGRKADTRTMDVRLLTKSAEPLAHVAQAAGKPFTAMPLSAKLQDILAKKGYTEPTPIQTQSIEALLEGRDLMGIAQTGTGKTAAFLLPLIERMLRGEQLTTLVVVPTRELAIQVEEEFRSLSKNLGFYAACFIGGTNLNRDLQKCSRPSHIVVGTPGRLLDLAQRRALRMDDFDVLILDEFDRMLDMGFAPDVNRIVRMMTNRRQTLLFSATVDKSQQRLIEGLLNNPVEVRVSTGEATGDHIEQEVVKVPEGGNKFQVLLDMLNEQTFDKVLIFAETKRTVNRMAEMLVKAGVKAAPIHGNKSQNARQAALDHFKAGRIQVLVATDVAARGIDVSDVTQVINYQVPRTYDSYVHRIGRTGRAGKAGRAFTFVD
jgi:ATP-dependent RNA helicase RhlE